MRKNIITGLLFLVMVFSLCACTSKEEKEKKSFEEALDAYQTYFDETIKSDYKSWCGARVVLDKDGFPVLFAGGVTGEGEQMSYNTMLYTYKDGKVVSVKEIHNESYYQMLAYADGIFAIEEKETVTEKKQLYDQNTEAIEEREVEIWKYYQLSGNELVSLDDVIDEEYQKWKTNIPDMLKEKCGDTMGYYELKELLQYLSSEKYYIGDNKEEYAQVSKAVKKLFQSIYKKLYGNKVQVSEFSALVDVDRSKGEDAGGNMLASPLISFEDDNGFLAASDFRHFITKLKEKGVMSQEEFIVWNLNFYCENFGAETVMSSALEEYSFVDVIQRNPMLINDIDSEYKKDETDMYHAKEGIIKYAFCNHQLELLNKIDVVKEMKPKEVKEYLLDGFVHYIVQDYCECEGKEFRENATYYYCSRGAMGFDDGTVEKEMEELVNDYIDKNVTGKTNEKMLKSCMNFFEKDLEDLLKVSYTEAVETVESNAWKQIYISYFQDYIDNGYADIFYGGYSFVDLDENGVPEIVVHEATQQASLYWIKDGELCSATELGRSNGWNEKTKEMLSISGNSMDWQSMWVSTFDITSGLKQIKKAYWSKSMEEYSCTIDDKECTKEEYDALEESYAKDVTWLGGEDVNDIIGAIKKYETGKKSGQSTDDKAQKTDEEASAVSDTEWKDAYIDYLSAHADEVGGCALAYLNDDEIPELFIHREKSPSHGAGARILIVIDGSVQQVGKQEYGSSGCVQIYERTGIFNSFYSGMGECHNYFYKMKENGKVEQIAYLCENMDIPETTKYYIEDAEVTKEEWDSKYAEVEPDTVEEKTVPSESLTAEEMQEEIRNMD